MSTEASQLLDTYKDTEITRYTTFFIQDTDVETPNFVEVPLAFLIFASPSVAAMPSAVIVLPRYVLKFCGILDWLVVRGPLECK